MAKNVNIEVKGSTLVITCNLDEDHGPSKSGKTTIIAIDRRQHGHSGA